MKEKQVEEMVLGLIQKAQTTGKPVKIKASAARRRSSLHQIIKTKEQGESFMKALQALKA